MHETTDHETPESSSTPRPEPQPERGLRWRLRPGQPLVVAAASTVTLVQTTRSGAVVIVERLDAAHE